MTSATVMLSLMLALCAPPAHAHATALRYGHASLVSNDAPALGFDLPLPGRYTARDQAPYAGALENGYPMDLSNERAANNYVTQRFPHSLRTAGVDTGNGQLMHVPEAPESPGEIPPYVPEVPEDRRDYSRPAGVRNGVRIRKTDGPTTAAPDLLAPAPAPVGSAEALGGAGGAALGKSLGSKAGASAGAVLGPGGVVVGGIIGGMVGKTVGRSVGTKVGAHVDKKLKDHSKGEAPNDSATGTLTEDAPKDGTQEDPATGVPMEEHSKEDLPREVTSNGSTIDGRMEDGAASDAASNAADPASDAVLNAASDGALNGASNGASSDAASNAADAAADAGKDTGKNVA
jgi:hypothetical protein